MTANKEAVEALEGLLHEWPGALTPMQGVRFERVKAGLQTPVPEGWQPIETACINPLDEPALPQSGRVHLKGFSMEEVWLDVPDFPGYKISNYGQVYSRKSNKVMAFTINNRGYKIVNLRKDGKCHGARVHRLVAEVHMGIGKGIPVNHIDKDKTNNAITNLEESNTRENTTHFYGRLTGASRNVNSNTWRSQIHINGRNRYLGNFATAQEAHECYLKALEEYGITNKYAQQSEKGAV